MNKQSLTQQLIKYCTDYKGEKENIKHKSYWNYERDMVEWIKLVVKETHIKINFPFIEEFAKQHDLELDITNIEHYISCVVPNIPRYVRLEQNEKHVRFGECFYDKFFASDHIWESYRKKIALPNGGITLSRS